MNPYDNLPPEKRRLQRLVDHYNADALLWRKLARKRRARRRLLGRALPRKRLKELDLQEFAAARPPQDCIGERIEQRVVLPSLCSSRLCG
jgi:hypothetical protein